MISDKFGYVAPTFDEIFATLKNALVDNANVDVGGDAPAGQLLLAMAELSKTTVDNLASLVQQTSLKTATGQSLDNLALLVGRSRINDTTPTAILYFTTPLTTVPSGTTFVVSVNSVNYNFITTEVNTFNAGTVAVVNTYLTGATLLNTIMAGSLFTLQTYTHNTTITVTSVPASGQNITINFNNFNNFTGSITAVSTGTVATTIPLIITAMKANANLASLLITQSPAVTPTSIIISITDLTSTFSGTVSGTTITSTINNTSPILNAYNLKDINATGELESDSDFRQRLLVSVYSTNTNSTLALQSYLQTFGKATVLENTTNSDVNNTPAYGIQAMVVNSLTNTQVATAINQYRGIGTPTGGNTSVVLPTNTIKFTRAIPQLLGVYINIKNLGNFSNGYLQDIANAILSYFNSLPIGGDIDGRNIVKLVYDSVNGTAQVLGLNINVINANTFNIVVSNNFSYTGQITFTFTNPSTILPTTIVIPSATYTASTVVQAIALAFNNNSIISSNWYVNSNNSANTLDITPYTVQLTTRVQSVLTPAPSVAISGTTGIIGIFIAQSSPTPPIGNNITVDAVILFNRVATSYYNNNPTTANPTLISISVQ